MKAAYRLAVVFSLAIGAAVAQQPPQQISVSPATATAGGPDFNLTVSGGVFFDCAAAPCLGIFWLTSAGNTFLAGTSLLKGQEMAVAVPASFIATPGPVTIVAVSSTGRTSPASFTILPPVPVIGAPLSPASVTAGGPAFTLTVDGSGFLTCPPIFVAVVPQCPFVNWIGPSGAAVLQASGSNTRITASIPANLIATQGTATVSVTAWGGISGTATISITPPPPAIKGLSPASATAGGPGFTLTVAGSGFIDCPQLHCLTVTWQSSAGSATLNASGTASQITTAVPAALIASPGSASVSVTALGGSSTAVAFNILPPAPTITSASPPGITAGAGAFPLTIVGSGFFDCAPQSCLAIRWTNGGTTTTLPASGSATQLTASVPANLIAAAGSASIAVVAQGGTSAPVSFGIAAPVPVISSVTPASATAGGPAFSLSVSGTGFLDCAPATCLAIRWTNGGTTTTLPASGSATQLTASVPANLIAAAGSASIAVVAQGGTSAPVSFGIGAPVPVISSVTPTSTTAGGPAFSLSVTGTGFLDCAPQSCVAIRWTSGGTTTTLPASGSATQLTASVPANLIAAAGTATLTVTAAGQKSNAVSFPITNPIPAITTVSPSSAPAGATAVSITITGSGFLPSSSVTWNGSTVPATVVSPADLVVVAPNTLLAAPGTVILAVVTPGQTPSNGLQFTINPPAITAVTPLSTFVNSPGFVMNVAGSNFVPNSTVFWEGTALITTFVSAAQVNAAVPALLLGAPATASITVRNTPAAVSGPATVSVITGPLNITHFDPASVTAGAAAFTLKIAGAGFLQGATAMWNGKPLATTFESAQSLTASVPAGLVAAQGAAAVSVANPGGVSSNSVDFAVTAAAPVITAVSPGSAAAGDKAFTITLTGSGFVEGSVVLWNGSPLTTAFVSATQVTTSVADGLVAQAGSAKITVGNPTGAVSPAVSFEIKPSKAPLPPTPPAITTIAPASVVAAGPGFTLTVNGTGFTAGATLQFAGTSIATAFESPAQLSASIPAALIATPGAASITVTNPDGGVSNARSLAITAPPLPTPLLTGPTQADPLQQPVLTVSIDKPYPLALTGQTTLAFESDTVNPTAGDPAIQFATGGTTFQFTVDSNSTQLPVIAIQTGATAGAITVKMTLEAGSQEVAAPDLVIRVPKAPPAIRSVKLTRTASTLQVDVTGFSTPREVTQAVFHFNGAPGTDLRTSDLTLPVLDSFTTWYRDAGSQQYGTQFTYTQTFNVQGGDTSAIGSVSVALANSAGVSAAVTSN